MVMIAKRRPRAFFTTHRVADRFAPQMRRSFLRALMDSRSLIGPLVEEAWPKGPEVVFQRIPWMDLQLTWMRGFYTALLGTVQASLKAHVPELSVEKQREPIARLGFSLDLTNPRAIRWAQEHAAELVVRLSEESKAAVRQLIVDMFAKGIDPKTATRMLRERLGLTPRDIQAVENVRRKLELESATRVTEGRKAIPQEGIDQQTERLANRFLAHRAEVIVRTESMTASNVGQTELWNQARDQGFIQGDEARRAWILTPDERLCPICEPMATDEKIVGMDESFLLGDGSVADQPPAHPQCLTGDTVVASRYRVTAQASRWYEGRLCVIRTTTGQCLRITPNHPILTDCGWVLAGAIDESHQLVCDTFGQASPESYDDNELMPTLIKEVLRSDRQPFTMRSSKVPVAAEDFHGDGGGSQIAVIRSDGLLGNRAYSSRQHPIKEPLFVSSHSTPLLPANGVLDLDSPILGFSPYSLMSRPNLFATLGHGHSGPFHQLGLTTPPRNNVHFEESAPDHLTADMQPLRYSFLRESRQVEFAQVSSVEIVAFHGNVHTLETDSGWYIANGIVVKNCRCTVGLVFRDERGNFHHPQA